MVTKEIKIKASKKIILHTHKILSFHDALGNSQHGLSKVKRPSADSKLGSSERTKQTHAIQFNT